MYRITLLVIAILRCYRLDENSISLHRSSPGRFGATFGHNAIRIWTGHRARAIAECSRGECSSSGSSSETDGGVFDYEMFPPLYLLYAMYSFRY